MKTFFCIVCLFLMPHFIHAQKGITVPGDTITILGTALNDEIKNILLGINYRKLAKIEMDQDSINYEFGIISVDRITDHKFRVRVVHAPIYDKSKTYLSVQDPFMILYQLRVVRKNGKLYLKEFKYLIGEI